MAPQGFKHGYTVSPLRFEVSCPKIDPKRVAEVKRQLEALDGVASVSRGYWCTDLVVEVKEGANTTGLRLEVTDTVYRVFDGTG